MTNYNTFVILFGMVEKLKWKTEKRKIKELKLFEGNPRKMSEAQAEQLYTSLQKFNLVEIPAIDQSNRILAGNMRIQALKKLGKENDTIDVRVPSRPLTEAEAKEYLIRSNKNIGEWDFDALANFDDDFLKEIGFESQELDKIFQLDTSEQDDVIPEVKKTSIKLGDMFQLGNHKLLCADCTVKENVERLMGGEKADMIFTDPPYGIDLDTDFASIHKGHLVSCSGKHKKFQGDKEKWDFQKSNWFDIKEQFWWGADYYLNNDNQGSWFVWDKTCGKFIGRIGNEFELCWSKQKHKREIVRIEWVGYNNLDTKKRIHPTQKPVELCKWFIEKFSKRGQNIIDLFLGSGSTLIACEKTNRKCYGMEISEIYCQVIIDRWEKYSGLKSKKIWKRKLLKLRKKRHFLNPIYLKSL